MHPVVYIESVSIAACLVAIVFLVSGWKRPDFSRAIPALLLTLLALMLFYAISLVLQTDRCIIISKC